MMDEKGVERRGDPVLLYLRRLGLRCVMTEGSTRTGGVKAGCPGWMQACLLRCAMRLEEPLLGTGDIGDIGETI